MNLNPDDEPETCSQSLNKPEIIILSFYFSSARHPLPADALDFESSSPYLVTSGCTLALVG